MKLEGLGAYPDDPYYDPNRPSWLPYWIDDLTESDAKYAATNIVQATANAGAMAGGAVVGGVANAVGDAAVNASSTLFDSISGSGLGVLAIGGLVAYFMFSRR